MIAKLAAAAAFSLIAYVAVAQTPPPRMPMPPAGQNLPIQSVNPQEQIERTIGSLFVQNTSLLAQVQSLQMQLTDLKKQLEDAKKALPEEPPK